MSATDADFFGEGGADQGTAKPLSLYERNQLEEDARKRRQEEDKRSRLARAGEKLATGDAQRTRTLDPMTGRPLYQTPGEGQYATGHGGFVSTIVPTLDAIRKDPVTAGVLLAPFGVVGAGAAAGGAGALGFGLGEGTIAGGAAAPAGIQAIGAPFSMASPHVAGTATGLGGAAAPAGAGAASAGAAAPAAASGWTAKDTARTFLPLGASIAFEGIKGLFGGDNSKEQKALIAKQEQMAREAEMRRYQMQNARMDAMGQRMAAFNPMNQRMAQMLGPDAAFKPEQLASMVQNPLKPQLPPELQDYRGTDDKKEQQIRDYMYQMEQYNKAEEARRQRVMNGVSPLPAGPAPISMPTPQAARRY